MVFKKKLIDFFIDYPVGEEVELYCYGEESVFRNSFGTVRFLFPQTINGRELGKVCKLARMMGYKMSFRTRIQNDERSRACLIMREKDATEFLHDLTKLVNHVGPRILWKLVLPPLVPNFQSRRFAERYLRSVVNGKPLTFKQSDLIWRGLNLYA